MSKIFTLVSSTLVLFATACTQIKNGEEQTAMNDKKGNDITLAERESWLKNLSPVDSTTGIATSEMKNLGGLPAIYAHGNPMGIQQMYFGYVFDDYGYKWKPDKTWHSNYARNLAGNGIKVYQSDIVIHIPSGKIDLARANSQIAGILKTDPDATFVLRIALKCGDEFAEKFPEEVTVFNDGVLSHFLRPSTALLSKTSTPRYSLSSRIWEREAAKGLVNMVKALSKAKYYDRIVGYILGVGAYSQSLYWGDFDQEKYALDYSPAALRRFKGFVREKYENDPQKLKTAWIDESANFDNIVIPTMKERGKDTPSSCNEMPYKIPGGFGWFRDPGKARNQKVIDYYTCMSKELGERLTYLCRVFKKSTGRRVALGAMFSPLSILGYTWGGESYFKDVLNCPDIDFFVYPWAYEGRGPGENIFFTSPMNTHFMTNKTSMIECDLRSSLTKLRGYGAPLDVKGDAEAIKKSFARIATYAAYGYWYDMGTGWYDNPVIFKTFNDISRIGKIALKLDRKRNSEIAVVYDQDSLFYASEWLTFITMCRQSIQEMGYIGADYDIYTTAEIGSPELADYKLYIFPNAFALNDEKIAKIRKYLQKDDKTLFWVYAPGLINQDKTPQLSIKNMKDVTGMNFGCIEGRHQEKQTITANSSLIAKNLRLPFELGTFTRPVTTGHGCTPEKPLNLADAGLYPQFYVDDDSVETIARFNDSGKTGFAVKKMNGWTSVYPGSIAIPALLIRAVAKNSKVHIYTDGDDLVYTNKNLLAISTRTAGEKLIRLPKKQDVYELFENRLVGRNIDSFSESIAADSTKLYFVGNLDDLEKIMKEKGIK